MDFKASDKPKKFDSKCDASVKKRDTPTLLDKRLFDDKNTLHISVKKSKVSPYDDIPSLKKERPLVKKSFEECKRYRIVEEKRLQSIKRDIDKCYYELKNKKTQVSCVRRINEIHQKMLEKVKEIHKEFLAKEGKLSLMEDLIGERKQELVTKERELRQVMDNISKQKHFESKLKKFESQEKEFEIQVKDLVSIHKHFESRMKELASKEKQHEALVMEHKSKESEFEGLVKELESKKKDFDIQVEELKSKERQLEGEVQDLESRKNTLDGRQKEIESKKGEFEGRVEDFTSEKMDFEIRLKELETKEKHFEEKVKEFELTKKQHDEGENEFDTSYMDDELSITIDGASEESDILVNLQESSDPSKIVLDVIMNPIIPLPKKGDKVVIIDESRIFMLEQLMIMSPNIKSCVKDEALKLAHELKANIKANTEYSLEVLGFLLILSVYGLFTYFDQDEVLDLFASVAEHKISVELFEKLGFANKVSDFVENLIKRKEFDSAVHVNWLRIINKFSH
ncbi:kinectin [Medicago truncatula]|uniref:kinectin n=1 Tax=Medicago truncatula TaxID=3880 RepID=UPI000D2F406A|nr:kinectin [Medicago truncatula]